MNITLDDIRDDITRAVRIALEEDIGSGDITAELIPEDKEDQATIITREDCLLCGQAWVDETYHQLGGLRRIDWHVKDGQWIKAGTRLVTLKGNTRRLLTGERTALNFLQTLSGTATKAHRYRQALGDSPIKLLDTRKTIPGLRTAQKYAVATGGCHNHRIGLYDAYLIKENHIAACGSIRQAVERARALHPEKTLEVEVETIDELKEALAAQVDVVMLDNFSEGMLRDIQGLDKGRCKYEVSGNLAIEDIRRIRGYNVDYVSFGGLTKCVEAVDLSFTVLIYKYDK